MALEITRRSFYKETCSRGFQTPVHVLGYPNLLANLCLWDLSTKATALWPPYPLSPCPVHGRMRPKPGNVRAALKISWSCHCTETLIIWIVSSSPGFSYLFIQSFSNAWNYFPENQFIYYNMFTCQKGRGTQRRIICMRVLHWDRRIFPRWILPR